MENKKLFLGALEKIFDFEELVMEAIWKEKLIDEFKKPYMQSLRHFLEKEETEGRSVFPPKEEIFFALNSTPFNEIKVVVIGQDPYHGVGQAHGLSFSVKKGVVPPPSLKNIYKELNTDLGLPIPQNGELTSWAKQGVLLLNAVLTVEAKKPRSHHGKGWEAFTDFIVDLLVRKEEPIVFMLWGRTAKKKCEQILLKNQKHLVLTAPHPSPFSAHTGFLGCKHFSKANAFLIKKGREPINWSL